MGSIMDGSMGIIIGVLISLVIGFALGKWGENRRIGFWPAFLLGVFIPILSVILILALGKKNVEIAGEMDEIGQEFLQAKLDRDQSILNSLKANSSSMTMDEKLAEIKKMRDDGLLSDGDYNNMKTNLLTGKGF